MSNRFTDIFIKRPVLATVVSLLILLFGLRSIFLLQVRQYPKMDDTDISITTVYPGANANTIQGFITTPVQQAISSAEGIDYVTSQSSQGVSSVSLKLRLGFNPQQALTEIMSKVAAIRGQLPRESEDPVISKSSGRGSALMYMSFQSKAMNNEQVNDYLQKVIVPKLETVPGVASAQILGGSNFAMRIWLQPNKLTAYHLAPSDVVQALQANNYQSAAGRIKGKQVYYDVTAKTDITTAKQFKQLVIKNVGNSVIRLQDVATVVLGPESFDSSVRFDSTSAVFLAIGSTPEANPLTVISKVRKVLPGIELQYPDGFKSQVVYDATEYIRTSIYEVVETIAEATAIVLLIIFLFLGSLRSVIIPFVAIPLSMIGVASLMLLLGYSLNLMTLLAMVLAIGLVVDDAIVVLENIYRHIEEGMEPFDAAIKGAREVAFPVIAMTITLAAVYLPIGFMGGLTGTLFTEFAFTLALSVIISGLVALTLSPMLCSQLITKNVSDGKLVQKIDQVFLTIKNWYEKKLRYAISIKPVILVFAIIVLVSCGWLASTTQSELAPMEDQGFLMAFASAPSYANLAYTEKYTKQMEKVLGGLSAVDHYFVINGMSGLNSALVGIVLKPWDQRDISGSKLKRKIQSQFNQIPGVRAQAIELPSIPGGGGGMPIQFVITTTAGYQQLFNVAQNLENAARKSGMFIFINSDLSFDKPQVQVSVDRDKAALMGVSMQQVGQVLASYMSEGYVSRFGLGGQSYKVIPEATATSRQDPANMKNLYVTSATGEMIPLGSLITIKTNAEPGELNQFQQLRSATLGGVMVPGKTIVDGLNFLKAKADTTLPTGFGYDFGGQSRQVEQEGGALLFVFFFSLVMIYLVLAAQFESFRDPLIVLISVPMSLFGALIFLNVGLSTLNIYSGIGLVTLIGLISKHGIMMVEFANQLQIEQKLNRIEAIIQAASIRLRPVLMTTAATMCGVIPLMLASGAGAVSRFDIGLVIFAGMGIGTCFTLFVVPAMYAYIAETHHEI